MTNKIQKIFKNRSSAFLFFFSVGLLVVSLVADQYFPSQEELSKREPPEVNFSSTTAKEVLGDNKVAPIFRLSADYGQGGVIALSGQEQPEIGISSYKLSGTAQIIVYKAEKKDLLNYLVHDQEGKQLNQVSFDQLEEIGLVEAYLDQNSGTTKVELPLQGTGIWAARIEIKDIVDTGFIVRSNFGSVLKQGDDQFIFWSQDLKTKRSLPSGRISLYDLENQVNQLDTISIEDQGIAETDLNENADIGLVESGGETAIVPINLRHLNRNYQYKYFHQDQQNADFYIFNDRPVYQPGDSVYFKAIIREEDDARFSLPDGNARVTIKPQGQSDQPIYQKTIQVSDQGTIYGNLSLPADVQTGSYRLEVDLYPGQTEAYLLKGYTYFQVEHFRKPEYTINLTAGKQEYIAGEQAELIVSGEYFTGQPVSGQNVKYKVYSSDFYEYAYQENISSQLEDRLFYGYRSGRELKKGTAPFNNQGQAVIDLNLELPEKTYSSQIFTIEAEFDDGSGNPVFARKNILVYAGEYGLYKENSNSAYIVDKEVDLQLKVVGRRKGIDTVSVPLKARLKRITWEKTEDPEKKYPVYEKKEIDLGELKAKTNQNSVAEFNFTPDEKGRYELQVQAMDERGNLVRKTFFVWVRKKGAPVYTGQYKDGLNFSTDKDKYDYQEKIKLTINSQIPDRDVLLSFDREKTNRFQVLSLQGNMKEVQLELKKTDLPNIYLSAASFSDFRLEKEIKEINLVKDPKKIKVSIETGQKKYGPGDVVNLQVKTTDLDGNPVSADTAVWAVDKAIYELGDPPKDILEAFWYDRYNSTSEAHSLEGINVETAEGGGCFSADTEILVDQGKTKKIKNIKPGDKLLTYDQKKGELVKAFVKKVHQAEVPGLLIVNQELKLTPNHKVSLNSRWQQADKIEQGDYLLNSKGEKVVVKSLEWQLGKRTVYNLEVDQNHTFIADGIWVHNEKGGGVREVFADTAYWNPNVRTDNNGVAELTFQLPDNLTTWVISGVSATEDTAVGQTTKEITVNKDLIVRPVVPNVFRIGDQPVVAALVQNFTEKSQKVVVELKFNKGAIRSQKKLQKTIKPQQMEQFYWELQPHESGAGKLVFSAQAAQKEQIKDVIEQQIAVEKLGFLQRKGFSGVGTQEYQLTFPDSVALEDSRVKLSLSPTIAASLPTAVDYLVGYPYGCVEQITSRMVPGLIVKQNPQLFTELVQDQDMDQMIEESIVELEKRQHRNGGWSWWEHREEEPLVTAYVLENLVKAKELGFQVSENKLYQARAYLNSLGKTKEEQIAKNYGLVVLGANSQAERITSFDQLSADLLSLAVMTNLRLGDVNPETNGVNQLLQLKKNDNDLVYWPAGSAKFFGTQQASTALAVRALLSAGRTDYNGQAVQFLMRNRKHDYWGNTFTTAQVLKTIVDYTKQTSELEPNYTYTVQLNGEVIEEGKMSQAAAGPKEIIIDPEEISSQGVLKVEKQAGSGELYSTVVVKQFVAGADIKAEDHGLKISRDYQYQNKTLVVGDTVKVKLSLSGLENRQYYGVIEDTLPAGLVPINTALDNEQFHRSGTYYPYGVGNQQFKKNGVVISLKEIPAGTNQFTYQARIVNAGTYHVPPAQASLMYQPQVWGVSDSDKIVVNKKGMVSVTNVKEQAKRLFNNKWILTAAVVGCVLVIGVTIYKIRIKSVNEKGQEKEHPVEKSDQ